jgi:lipid A ethanolaminephosphotransferase
MSLFMAVAYNWVFYAKVLAIYPLSLKYSLFHATIVVVLLALHFIVLCLFSWRHTTKLFASVLFIASSLVCYFVGTYGIVVDSDMLRNVVETNLAESLDLFSFRLVLYVLLVGVLPSLITWRLDIKYPVFPGILWKKFAQIGIALVAIFAALLATSATSASFLRAHKSVRKYVNPAGYLYAVGDFVGHQFSVRERAVQPYALDARKEPRGDRRRLVIVVVGETARADRFSLNGYARETNPLLKREEVVSFTNVMSAGTSTAISVPSMFSHLPRASFDAKTALYTENVLDILARIGVSVLWRDNNSSSKGVADRVAYEDFKTAENNPIFDTEARDEGMLVNLQSYIDRQPGDVLIVLHQMGNHGPAYYKRYPKEFEVFTPVCKSNQLEQCTKEEIDNAYDNAILYTDYFLSKVIALLKQNDERFETAMLYFSDHGESLGENKIYLHGYPYALAPIEQKHMPAVFWFGQRFPIDRAGLRSKANEPYSHDNLFHTLLGLYDVKTQALSPALDMITPFRTD